MTPWTLIPLWVRALVILAAVSAFVGGITWGIHTYNESLREEGRQEEHARRQAEDLKDAQAKAKETFRRLEAQQENDRAYADELARYKRAAADAVAERDGLRIDVANLGAVVRAGLSDSATADQRKAGAAAAGVLSNLYGGADALAEIYARQADSARRSGQFCERNYDSLTKGKP